MAITVTTHDDPSVNILVSLEIDEEPEGRDIPDSAGTINGNGIADAATVAPSSMVKKEVLVAPLVESPVVPLLLPTPANAPPPSGRKTKTPGKPRKPRAPSSSTPSKPDFILSF